jgi:hypothetical protein
VEIATMAASGGLRHRFRNGAMASHEASLRVDKTKEIRDEKENLHETLAHVRR